MSQVAGSTPAAATIWQRFAKMLGIEERHAEDALHSERVAKHVVSRRSFIGAAGVLAGASLFSFASVGDAEAAELKREFDRQLPVRRGGSTLSSFDAMLKQLYTDDKVDSLVWGNADPFFAMLKRREPLIIGQNAQHAHNGSFAALYDRRPLTGS